MRPVDRELDRVLTLLRNKIRERGFTQLEVQEALSWGRSYISQLLTKQKSLRVEQVLLILEVIGVDPVDFFDELYHFPRSAYDQRPPERYQQPSLLAPVGTDAAGGAPGGSDVVRTVNELSSLIRGLLKLLGDKDLITGKELEAAVVAARSGSNRPGVGA